MRCLDKNKQKIYYATYLNETATLDEHGNETSEYTVTYSTPIAIEANVSGSRGNAEQEMFGIDVNYTKTVVIDKVDIPIDENSILWVDISPINDTKHNYVVAQVAKSLNSTAIAIREVDVS